MRQFFKKYGKFTVTLVIVIISLSLIISAISMLTQYNKGIAESSSDRAINYTIATKEIVESKIDENTANALTLAGQASVATSQSELYECLKNFRLEHQLYAVRYYKGDVFYSEEGNVLKGYDEATGKTNDINDTSWDFRQKDSTASGYVGSFLDVMDSETGSTMGILGFYAPVKNSELLDAVVIYFTRNKVEEFFTDGLTNTDAEFSVLCVNTGDTGEILVAETKDDVKFNSGDIYSEIRDRVGLSEPVAQLKNLVKGGKTDTIAVKIQGVNYLVSVGASAKLGDLAVVELYSVDVLAASGNEFVGTVTFIIIIFVLIALGVIFYLIAHRLRLERQLFDRETLDKHLDCYNRHGFEKEAKKILDRNDDSYFAVVVVQLKHYKYLLETYGDGEAHNLLSYLRLTCAKIVQLEETYGHVEDGQFLFLLHAKDRTGLTERLKIHSFLVGQYKGGHSFDVLLKYGIYEIDKKENLSVIQMIDFANEANNTIERNNLDNVGIQFNFYDDELRKVRLIQEDMELRMEGALQNGEFQVFYQPKYNLNIQRQDGCEALVRWYDPASGKYNLPALFIQLFESNGFIVKLDKYVYTKVCEYISYSIAHGRTVYPVSVNISRITAVQPDFVDYYTKIKKKYGISDGQIMIEFTESFAYENYEMLGTIVDQLHKAGFKCSIDDFGCGYSSYRILKTLPMDEIKLDKFFLEDGTSHERDECIFESIINLAKDLGMKVTQEGVETIEDVNRLKAHGCDVVQGYYYSHPLALSDYINFVATSREHNI